MFLAFGAKCGGFDASGLDGKVDFPVDSARRLVSEREDKAMPPMLNPVFRKKCRRVILSRDLLVLFIDFHSGLIHFED